MSEIKVFKNLQKEELKLLKDILETVKYGKKEIICREGTKSDKMYFIEKGTVDVLKAGVNIGELNVGDSFGEMGLLEGQSRSATVVSREELTVYVLKKENFQDLYEKNMKIYTKILFEVAINLSKKLRDVDDRLKTIWDRYTRMM